MASDGSDAEINKIQKASTRHLAGHRKTVHSLAWSTDALHLASGSIDQTVRIWLVDDTGHGKEKSVLRGHTESVDQLIWHPTDSHLLASASGDQTMKVWDTRTSRAVHSVTTSGPNINVGWSRDGKYISVGDRSDVVTIIDAVAGKELKKARFAFEVNEMAWDKNGYLFLSVGSRGVTDEGRVEIMAFEPESASLSRIHTLHAHTGIAYAMAFARDDSCFVTGASDGIVAVFDANDLICKQTIDRMEYGVRSVSVSVDSRYLAIGSEDLAIDIVRLSDGSRVRVVDNKAPTNCVKWHPTKLLLAFACDDKLARDSDRGMVGIMAAT